MSNSGLVEHRLQVQRAEREKRSALVRRLSLLRQSNPSAYQAKAVAFAILGYSYVLFILLLGLAILALSVWLVMGRGGGSGTIKLGLFGLLLSWMILRALWVRVKDDEPGILVDRARCPRLFDDLEDVCRKLQAPHIDSVKIGWDANAWAAELPMLGIFGFHRRRLYIGMPLFYSLSPEQLRSVVAHEMGHFSERHGRFGLWLYRLEMTWMRIAESLDRSKSWTFNVLLGGFLRWYIPRMNAYAGVLSRGGEFDADRYAREIAGEEAPRALLRLTWIDPHLQKQVHRRLNLMCLESEVPATGYVAEIERALGTPPDADWAEKRLRAALATETDEDGTHPSLKDRLAQSGFEIRLDDPEWVRDAVSQPETTAATAMLAEALPGLRSELDDIWRSQIAETWQGIRREMLEARARVDGLRARADLSPEERVELATGLDALGDLEGASAMRAANLAAFPDEPLVLFDYGVSKLTDDDDPAGLPFVERAMELDPELREAGLSIVADFHASNADTEDLAQIRARSEEDDVRRQVLGEELQAAVPKDRYVEHGLSAEVVARVVEKAASVEGLAVLYLVRRQFTRVDHRPYLFVMGVLDPNWRRLKMDDQREAKLQKALLTALDLEERAVFFVPQKPKAWEKAFAKVPGSLVYRAGK